ncbi:MAG: SDR family oxidoreductase [Candidatus Competibacteraceae bacterium]|nr:SDR family oxidoreductase [Candidatus Competibacteraceae bacterium]
MKGILEGKIGIITGALDENSIAWKVAEQCHAQGARFILSNAPVALRMGKINELAEQCNTEVVSADASVESDWENLFHHAMNKYGGKVDFVLHSIGMSPNVRKGRHYTDLNYDWFLKSLDISALSFHKMLQTAQKLDAISEWGSVLALSYIAAQRTFPDYNDMAEAKALLESIARSYGYHYGVAKKVRINTISQSPTRTTAGTGVGKFDIFFDYANRMSPLGNASADDCAKFCAVMFSDFARMITMQNIYHDGGFSSVGISASVVDNFK